MEPRPGHFGVLVESLDPLDEIPHPLHPNSGEFVGARKSSRGWFAVALDGENFFKPIPIDERDVRHYRVSVPNLVDLIRQQNGIDGESFSSEGNLVAVGQKVLEGFGTVEVYLSLENDNPNEFAARCRGIRSPQAVKKVVVLLPRPIPLANTQRQLLENQRVILISLREFADQGSFKGMLEELVADGTLAAIENASSGQCDAYGEDHVETFPAVDEPLSERAQNVLIAMLDSGALDSDHRLATQEIAFKALGGSADANALKAVMSELKTREYVESKTGRGGGCWLTDKGLTRAIKLRAAYPKTPQPFRHRLRTD